MSQLEDFWWLPNDLMNKAWTVGVGHHDPLTEEHQPSAQIPNQEEPVLASWWHSVDEGGTLSRVFRPYPLSFLSRWRDACRDANVYRTLRLSVPGMDMVGPFLVDIDNEDRAAGDSGLADALSIARMTLEFLVEDWKLVQADFQIFFSGHKGFNIEVRPLALGLVGTYEQQIERSKDRLDSVIRALQSRRSVSEGAINAVSNNGTVIDRIYSSSQGRYSLKHPYVRLRGSANSWLKPDRVEISRLRTELAAEDLFALSAGEVVALAET